MLIEEKKDNSFEVKNTPHEDTNIADAKRLTIDAKQAAALIGISYWSILEMCKRGEIPYIPVGSRKLFRMESLTSWLAAREAGTTKQ
ncbi:MAG TPA: helix-turn-helix domain-containing protein [Candidatus Wallbacteria bacterium]|nr:helix-turn-helix domain-containing protein [Candidatus Wallbacteria bacterium]